MSRSTLWKSISDTLLTDISSGLYPQGEKLPTEAQLGVRFGVNRHTVRRALAHLVDEGIVHTRRGSGAFVAQKPTEYALGKRVRYHQNLEKEGRSVTRRVLMVERRRASREEATALRLEPNEKVQVYEGLNFGDQMPLAMFRSVFPAARFPDILDDLSQGGSVTQALEARGVGDYTRASTRINATLATATQALHLRVNEGAPLLHTIGVNVDEHGSPIEYGTTWFVGDRVTLTLEDL